MLHNSVKLPLITRGSVRKDAQDAAAPHRAGGPKRGLPPARGQPPISRRLTNVSRGRLADASCA